MNNRINELTNDIVNAYAALTNRDSDWVEQLSIQDFVEIRKEAILELEKNIKPNISTKSNKKEKQIIKKTPKEQEEQIEQNTLVVDSSKKIEKPIKEIKEPIKNNEKKENNEIKPKASVPQVQEKDKIVEKETIVEKKEEKNMNEIKNNNATIKQPQKEFDAKHDQEELDLFNRLKD